MTLFSSVATLWRVLVNLAKGNLKAFEVGGQPKPFYVTSYVAVDGGAIKAKPTITRQEDGLLVTASFKVSLPQEARVYGYCYLASRSESPMPIPEEFARLVTDAGLRSAPDRESIALLYQSLIHYFGVSQRTFHVSWSLDPEGPFLAEKDLLLPAGQYTVYGQVLIPGWAVYNHIYKELHSPLYDTDSYTFSCALSTCLSIHR